VLHEQRDHVKKHIKASFKRRSSSVSGLLESASQTIEQKKDKIIMMMLFCVNLQDLVLLQTVKVCHHLVVRVKITSVYLPLCLAAVAFRHSLSNGQIIDCKKIIEANCNVHNSYSHLKSVRG